MAASLIAQFALDQSIRLSDRLGRQGRSVLWNVHSRMMRRLGSAVVTYELFGCPIKIPASSDLPSVHARIPEHGQNLRRIAGMVSAKYPDCTMIDIGANVGDTALLLRSVTECPLLCIEGSQVYFTLCRDNLSRLDAVTVVHTYVDRRSHSANGRIVERLGSGRIVSDSNGRIIPMRSLSEILCDHPEFYRSKLIKSDTDGFDGRILQGACGWLREAQPVIFWECELRSDAEAGGPGRTVFDLLADAGYGHFVFYSNSGDYVATAGAGDGDLLDDLCWYLGYRPNRDRVGPAYADVCAIPGVDSDLARSIREIETGTLAAHTAS